MGHARIDCENLLRCSKLSRETLNHLAFNFGQDVHNPCVDALALRLG